MISEFDFQYALEQTRVLCEPDRRIDTFGNTQFEFQMVSELMDQIGVCRVRSGRIEAYKPLILRPDGMSEFDFDGFTNLAEGFGDWLKANLQKLAFMKYGFKFKRTEVTEELVHESVEMIANKLLLENKHKGNPALAIIQGVDDTWEFSLLKFTVEMVEKSARINEFDFRRKGLL
jgi:hypothetical protein